AERLCAGLCIAQIDRDVLHVGAHVERRTARNGHDLPIASRGEQTNRGAAYQARSACNDDFLSHRTPEAFMALACLAVAPRRASRRAGLRPHRAPLSGPGIRERASPGRRCSLRGSPGFASEAALAGRRARRARRSLRSSRRASSAWRLARREERRPRIRPRAPGPPAAALALRPPG